MTESTNRKQLRHRQLSSGFNFELTLPPWAGTCLRIEILEPEKELGILVEPASSV